MRKDTKPDHQKEEDGFKNPVNQLLSFEDQLQEMIKNIDNVYDFYIPIEQIELEGFA